MPGARESTAVLCNVCGRKIGRNADLPRHMKTHAENKEALKHRCPHCPFGALQRSNLDNHLNSCTGKRPYKCPEEGCTYRAAERGTLSRHRKSRHGYQPKKKCATSTTSSSTSGSSRTLNSSSPSSSLSPSPSYDHVEEGNASSAHTTEFINDSPFAPNAPLEYATPLNSEFLTASEEPPAAYQQLPALDHPLSRFNNWQYAESSLSPRMVSPSAAPVECAPLLNSGILVASEEPVTVHSHRPIDERGELYSVGTAVQPVSQMSISEEEHDSFISLFNNWESAESSLSTRVVSSSVHAPTTLPPYEGPYPIDNVPAATTLPPYEDQYGSLMPTPAALPPYVENPLIPTTASLHMVSPSVAPVEYASSQLANSDRVRPRLPVYEQGELYAVGAAVQPVHLMSVSEEYDSFISQLRNWESAESSLSTPVISSSVNVHAPVTLPLYEGQYSIDDVATSTTLPSHEDQYGSLIHTPAALPPYAENTLIPAPAPYLSHEVESVNAAYEYYNPTAAPFGTTSTSSQPGSFATPEAQPVNAAYQYHNPTADAAPFNATGIFPQPGLFATPDMGLYPQDVDQGSYNAYAGTSGFAMDGFYVN